jgi:hypothetical protein
MAWLATPYGITQTCSLLAVTDPKGVIASTSMAQRATQNQKTDPPPEKWIVQ